jgi:hypothetical protein
MKKSTVKIQITVALAPEKVFDTFTNHESYRKVPLILNTKLIKEGEHTTSNGTNAIREINFIGGSLTEVVTDMQYPLYWDYLFLKWPLPMQHLGGRMQFDKVEQGTIVTWSTEYNAEKFPKFISKSIDSMSKAFLLYAAKSLSKIALKDV